ncbi:hypothetical protein AK812_SmicGene18278 [Symbiodinium microadriaticum]|uniref:Uncharacterized protein n=1 Tax=Symbiodinium microadriaticum TaxID=2951 RepID=A0A1Q9DVP9_SYMMI|nr:hypothetical protein AK812_SmicGene18278 [Symbiodinium microadriaticum]CAE6911196.1 unnamed protein product [Symbiodinium sp. KB8]
MWMLASFGLRSRPVPAPAMLGGSMPKGASKQKHSTKASCRTWLLACVTFAILGVQQIKMFVTLPQTSRQSEPMDSRRRALILGGMSFAAFEDQAHAASSAAAKIKECQAEASKIVGGLESTAKNALAMTPGQVAEQQARGPPKLGSFETLEGPCSTSALRAAADSLAASPPAGLTRYELQRLQDAPKRIVEARTAIVEANANKQGPRLFGAVRKYMDASGSLLVGIP